MASATCGRSATAAACCGGSCASARCTAGATAPPPSPPACRPSSSPRSRAPTMLTDDPMAVAGIPQLASASATRMLWHTVADRDPDALVSQTPEWVDVLCRSGYEDATRTYWAADGSRMVLPLVR